MRYASLVVLLGCFTAIVSVACGDALDESPLGGPYGGEGTFVPPVPPSRGARSNPIDAASEAEGAADAGTQGTFGSGGSLGSFGTGGSGGSLGSLGSLGSGGSGGTGGVEGFGGSGGAASVDGGGGAAGTAGSGGSGGSPPGAAIDTWSKIFDTYFAKGTVGNCVHCHSELSSATKGYAYLVEKGQIGGTTSRLANPADSDLTWLGGNMPPGGPKSDVAAASALDAWVAAGALDN